MKKLLAFALSFLLILGGIPVLSGSATDESIKAAESASIPISGETGSKMTVEGVTYTVVRNAEGLKAQIKNGKIQESLILADDIDFGGEEFSGALATLASGVTLNGNGHSMGGFSVKNENAKGTFGLFGNPAAGGKVRICNLTIGSAEKNIIFSVKQTGSWIYFGVLFGKCDAEFDIENVTVYAQMTNTASAGGGTSGFVGASDASKGNFINCNFYGEITVTKNTSSVTSNLYTAAFLSTTTTYQITAGDFSFEGCHNYGTITGGNKTSGFISQAIMETLSFSNCTNNGKITGNENVGGLTGLANVLTLNLKNCSNQGKITGTTSVGGMIGFATVEFTADNFLFDFINCENRGNISASRYAGGMIGQFGKAASVVNGSVNFRHCNNYGTISATGTNESWDGFGGIIGYQYTVHDINLIQCANLGAINGTGANGGGAIGLSYGDKKTGSPLPVITLDAFVNAGAVTSSKAAGGIIAVCGRPGEVKLKNCVNIGTVTVSGSGVTGEIYATTKQANASVVTPITFDNCMILKDGNATEMGKKPTVYTDPKAAVEAFNALAIGTFAIENNTITFTPSEPWRYVQFVGTDGKFISSVQLTGGSATVERFPDVSAVNGGDIIWIDQTSGALVTAPVTFTEETTVAAFEKGINATDIIGYQYGVVDAEGKQKIRFIGGVYNISGNGIGFDVLVTYKDKDGNTVENKYRVNGTTVYESINAVEHGTLKNVTAKELGACYLFGLILEVPVDVGQLNFTVAAFKTVGDNNIRVYSDERSFSMANGKPVQ